MLHANTLRLIDDWQGLKGARMAPARSDIQPAAFREILTQLFILGGDTGESFRLAGGLLVDLHGRELRGASFLELWPYPDRSMVADALCDARTNSKPVVLEATAWTAEGYEAGLEIMLAPLTGPEGAIDRLLGLYQPTSSLRGLWNHPVEQLTLRAIKRAPQLRAAERTRLRLAALDGQRLG